MCFHAILDQTSILAKVVLRIMMDVVHAHYEVLSGFVRHRPDGLRA